MHSRILAFVGMPTRLFGTNPFQELREFVDAKGHPNVPTTYCKNAQLATWVKCRICRPTADGIWNVTFFKVALALLESKPRRYHKDRPSIFILDRR